MFNEWKELFMYKGWPFLGFGYGAMYTNKHVEINRIWYIFDKYPVMLKTRLWDSKDKFRNFVYRDIKAHPEMQIVDEYFDDRTREVDKDTPGAYKYTVVYAENSKGRFYLGTPDSAFRKLDMYNFRTSRPTESEGVACVAKIIGEDRWCGWSHRAKVCFGIGDKVFDSKYGDDKTIFSQHGDKTIENETDMIEAASRFAQYIS